MNWNQYRDGVSAITNFNATLSIPKVMPRLNGALQTVYIFSHKPGTTVLLRPMGIIK